MQQISMKVIRTIPEIRATISNRKNEGMTGQRSSVALVPTMGFLHEGHLSLIQEARKHNDVVVVSIFVNPLQFGPNEDFEQYPRDVERDLKLLEQENVDLVFLPAVQEMYPNGNKTTVSVAGITERLCGASRPGHFDGVATVVSKLFHIILPDRAYFGVKDAQQVAVISKMCEDLNMPIEIVPCPTLREFDGLARSSRNVRLSPAERTQAAILYQALQLAEQEGVHCTVSQLKEKVISKIQEAALASIDYVDIVTFPDFEQIDEDLPVREALKQSRVMVALAVYFGKTRLIDNVILANEELI